MLTMVRALFIAALAVSLAACSFARETQPDHSATEQLLFSAAMDRVGAALALEIPKDSKVFVEDKYAEGTDSKYLVATIRDRVLRSGGMMAATRDGADLVLEPRIGASSIDRKTFLFGIPGFPIPIPLVGPLQFPELALFKRDRQQGVVKLAITSYDAKTGALHQSADPVFSFSQRTDWVALLFISWQNNDLVPEPYLQDWTGKGTFD
ncbi:MAG: hypothetical protein NWR87_01475 [Rhodospirillales bacterium]|jgi:hypothetical protein|nr:hypothetical protein [Rhodospirillales bacterium]